MAGRTDAARADATRALHILQRLGNQQLLVAAYNAQAMALQHDDPQAALAAAEHGLAIARTSAVNHATLPGLQSLAATLQTRLGDHDGALALLHDALTIARDGGLAVQAATVIGYAISPLRHIAANDAAATVIGVLDHGAFAHIVFPGMADARNRALTRIREALGDDKTDRLLAEGAAMTYDQAIAYALDHLRQDQSLAQNAEPAWPIG